VVDDPQEIDKDLGTVEPSSVRAERAATPETPGFFGAIGEMAGQTTGDLYRAARHAMAPGPMSPGVDLNDVSTPEALNEKYGLKGSNRFTRPMVNATAEEMVQALHRREKTEEKLALFEQSHNWLVRNAAGFIGGMLDPVEAAAMMVPGIGEERLAFKMIEAGYGIEKSVVAGKIVAGATGAMAGTAALEPLRFGMSADELRDWSMKDALTNVFYSAPLGAMLHAGVSPAIGYGASRLNGSKPSAYFHDQYYPEYPKGVGFSDFTQGDLRASVVRGVEAGTFDASRPPSFGHIKELADMSAIDRNAMQKATIAQIMDGREPNAGGLLFPDHSAEARKLAPEAHEEWDRLQAEHDQLAAEHVWGRPPTPEEAASPEYRLEQELREHVKDILPVSWDLRVVASLDKGKSGSAFSFGGEGAANPPKGLAEAKAMEAERAPVRHRPLTGTFASRVSEVVSAIGDTHPSFGKTAIAEAYEAYSRVYSDAGSFADFKKRLVDEAKKRNLTLSRLDMPERMSKELRESSAAKWDGDTVHYINNVSQEGERRATSFKNEKWTKDNLEQFGKGSPKYSREEIWEKTGWHKGETGHWLFEIDDSKATLNEQALADTNRPYKGPLSGVFNHEAAQQRHDEIQSEFDKVKADYEAAEKAVREQEVRRLDEVREKKPLIVAQGMTDPATRTAWISAMAVDPKLVAREESGHAIRASGLFKGEEWGILRDAAINDGWIEDMPKAVQERYHEVYADRGPDGVRDAMVEEAVMQRFAKGEAAWGPRGGPVSRLMHRIRELLERIGNWMTSRGFQSANDVFRAMEEGKISARDTMQPHIARRADEIEARMNELKPTLEDAYKRAKDANPIDLPSVAQVQRTLWSIGFAPSMPTDELQAAVAQIYGPKEQAKTHPVKPGETPPELQIAEQRYQTMLEEGYVPTQEEIDEHKATMESLQQAMAHEQGYQQAAECLLAAGI
jgi:hypothetical protein